MKSENTGTTILDNKTEVTNISIHGIWLIHQGIEYFLAYKDFPWFKEARLGEILNLETPSSTHFYWPDLDVDLHLDSIKKPGKYPLVYR